MTCPDLFMQGTSVLGKALLVPTYHRGDLVDRPRAMGVGIPGSRISTFMQGTSVLGKALLVLTGIRTDDLVDRPRAARV